jgi:hypothetical protein
MKMIEVEILYTDRNRLLRHSTAVHLLKSGVDLSTIPIGWVTPASIPPINT